ncbi:MAG TPA: hypothetical protein EYG86_00800 [Crocinitomicaceae bacterium]|nr:hypothetical protein [Crocinitomicaceae bacterium]
MKLGKLLLATFLILGATSFAQDDTERECKRMRFLAGEELKIKNYKGAVSYYIKGEAICGNYDAANYKRLIGSTRNAINSTTDKEKVAYIDTVVATYIRMETAGFYDKKDDLLRASYILQSSKPDRDKADGLFRRGVDTKGKATGEGYVSYFYYNTYAMFAAASGEKKANLKKRMITEYFELSSLISEAGMSVKTQETITGYFNAVVKDCKDILPELNGYMENLPEDNELKKGSLMNFITLLEKKKCTDAPEYGTLINKYVEADPTSLDAQLMKAKYLTSKGKTSEAIKTLRTAKGITTDDAQKQEITYQIAVAQFKAHSYTAAYNTAMSVKGKYRGKSLAIAGKAVGSNANNCGASTFDRKCNYIYAVQLLEKARAQGGDVGGSISSYKSRYPTSSDIFENGSPASVTLSCYGVSVNPKQ